MRAKRCINPNCVDSVLVRMDIESSWTFEKYFCPNPKCGRIYTVPTTTGKVVQVSPLASAAILAVGLLTMDAETAVEQAAKFVS